MTAFQSTVFLTANCQGHLKTPQPVSVFHNAHEFSTPKVFPHYVIKYTPPKRRILC